MATIFGVPAWLALLAVVSAALALVYFLYLGLREDHRTGEYHFTWGVGVVILFLLGFAPGLVGLGLYLTVEHGYPVYWLLVLALAAFVVVTAVSVPVETTIGATETFVG